MARLIMEACAIFVPMKMHVRKLQFSLVFLALVMALLPLRAQYTLDEIGVNLGAGYTSHANSTATLGGPAARASLFYSHYFCGKAFGLQGQAGIRGQFPRSQNGSLLFPAITEAGTLSMTQLQGEIGFFLKVRAHDYHRRKEWALLFGPVLPVPVLTHFKSGAASGNAGDLGIDQSLSPSIHLSLQFRRPIDKASWFIQPGVEFSPSRTFRSTVTDFRTLNVFLSFGYAFWEKRG